MAPKLSLQRLETFVAVVEHGGLSAAARALGIAQSTVSSNLQLLERELGVVLVDRSGRAARPTDAGEVLIDHARALLSLAAEAADQVTRLRSAPISGVLEVGGTATVTQQVLPRLLTSFAGRYPGIEIDLHVDNSAGVVRAVTDGRLPLAVIAAETDKPSLEATRVGSEPQTMIVASDHPLAGREASPHELRGSRILLREEGSASRRYQVALLEKWRIPRAHTSTIASNAAIIGAVAHGLGISCLPRSCAADAHELGRISEVHLEPAPPTRPINLVRLAERPLTLIEELFLGHVREKEGVE
ncbi:LysR family transcriptional regulator [Rhodococcus xishaensis]|uniref:LysR family transcriptional regulator n=1 Tax=Rhodococcus xishaensis TaxID=2487364 RepID=A0A438AT73_9NOCA|nr:LysR family transcriptional regulator [Rhodococcus xishaensis]RVW02001.1 LysR family transcriptional regulator [Rhodococcus xishaensis]